MFRMWGAEWAKEAGAPWVPWMLPHGSVLLPVCLAETTLVCLSVFPGMAIKHGRLREICLWRDPSTELLPVSSALLIRGATGTSPRARLLLLVSWLGWKTRAHASLSRTPFPSAPDRTEIHQGTLHVSQGRSGFLQVSISLVTQ